MILKQSPADFRVEELTAVATDSEGVYALYRLDKASYTTPAALAIVRDRWHIEGKRLACGGLKDRHASTTQFFTIRNGPARNLQHDTITVTYLHQVALPYESTDIQANRFTLTVRDLTTTTATLPERVPNYFDDQRFGSVGDGEFIAKLLVQERYEEALRLALVAPYEFDRKPEKQTKHALRMNWGRWDVCLQAVRDRTLRAVLEHLRRTPADFRGACLRLPEDLLVLYLHAWQSHLWNRLLDAWIRANSVGPVPTVTLKTGEHALPSALTAEATVLWSALELPLPSARLQPDVSAPWWPLLEAVMADEGLPLHAMAIPNLRKPFFSKGSRTAAIAVSDFQATFADDERHSGKQKATLRFDLPRGCYATMVVKCLGL